MNNQSTTQQKSNQSKFKFPLSVYAGEKHPCATKPITSPNFYPARTDIFDKQGNKIYSAGDPITTMYTMDWTEYGSYKPNLDRWAIDFPELINNSMKPRQDELDTQQNLRDSLYEDADETDSIKERETLLQHARYEGQKLWAMKAKRAGYYDKSAGAQVTSEDDARIGESNPVSELRDNALEPEIHQS